MTPTAIDAMRRAAAAAHPRECCGLLLGQRLHDGQPTIESILPVSNRAQAPTRGYEFDPKDLLVAEERARVAGLEVVGVYHSHPDGRAAPSARDLRTAVPGWLYAVVGAPHTGPAEVRCYRLLADGSALEEVPLG